ncbi:MAG: hypothetical protein V3T17_11390 [Pseudomonadales bacterium]
MKALPLPKRVNTESYESFNTLKALVTFNDENNRGWVISSFSDQPYIRDRIDSDNPEYISYQVASHPTIQRKDLTNIGLKTKHIKEISGECRPISIELDAQELDNRCQRSAEWVAGVRKHVFRKICHWIKKTATHKHCIRVSDYSFLMPKDFMGEQRPCPLCLSISIWLYLVICIPDHKAPQRYRPTYSFFHPHEFSMIKPPRPMDIYNSKQRNYEISIELQQWLYERELLQTFHCIFISVSQLSCIPKPDILLGKRVTKDFEIYFNKISRLSGALLQSTPPLVFKKNNNSISFYYDPKNYLKDLEVYMPNKSGKKCRGFQSYLKKEYYFYDIDEQVRLDGLTENQRKLLRYGYDYHLHSWKYH